MEGDEEQMTPSPYPSFVGVDPMKHPFRLTRHTPISYISPSLE